MLPRISEYLICSETNNTNLAIFGSFTGDEFTCKYISEQKTFYCSKVGHYQAVLTVVVTVFQGREILASFTLDIYEDTYFYLFKDGKDNILHLLTTQTN